MRKKHFSVCILASHLVIMKRNVAVFGLIIGLLMPVLGIVVMYFMWFHSSSFGTFFSHVSSDHQLAAKVLSLSLIAELIPFIYFTNKRLDNSARGIFIATIIYGVLIVLLKYVWS
jgi:hypothetical protein